LSKKTYIGLWVLIGAALAATLAIVILFFAGGQKQGQEGQIPVTIRDAEGQVLLTATSLPELYDADCWAYLELAVEEAMAIVAQQEDCSSADAKKHLFSDGYEIHTAFDPVVFRALKETQTLKKDCSIACAVTDLQGGLVAVFCEDTGGKQINYLTQRRSPYSAFKVLSVYTPAMEKGIVNWSKLYYDGPYKQTKDENGVLRDWPANASDTYSRENKTVFRAVKTSLNTVAVKCLAEVKVSESIAFLQKSFALPLKEEAYVLKEYGEDEVIGSIALGYLETGVTPVEMAGYYQIFANGGQYAAPKTVNKITLDAAVVYTRPNQQKQVVSAATADTMNKLLQGVVSKGGTGEAASCYNVEVAGKTGTGDDYADNWFVGVTPGYSMAVWHGQENANYAGEMFSLAIQKLYETLPGANTKFVTHKNIYQLVYCVRSGKGISEHCTTIDTGYYSEAALQTCDVCGAN